MDVHERRLSAYLDGELDRAAARDFDEHLLACERCWRAVHADRLARETAARLREAPPVDLADRVRIAVELAEGQRPPSRRGVLRPFMAGTALLAALASVLLALLLPSRPAAAPAPVAAVVQYALLLPSASAQPSYAAAPAVAVAGPLSLSVDGTRVVMRYYRVGAAEVAVAIADRAFPEPAGARAQTGTAMAWSASVDGVSLYCPNSRVLLAARIPVSQLVTLAADLPSD
jgi:anti-sigma factor RsiW